MKRILSVVLALLLLMTCIPLGVVSVSAYTAHTVDEAMAYLHTLVGKKVGSGQCVALVVDYYLYLGVSRPYGNGEDYATNALPSGWTRIKGAQPQKGDIMIWTGTTYGHVAICGGEGVYFHQNWDGLFVSIKNKSYTNGYNIISTGEHADYWGVIRPDFKQGTPSPSVTLPGKPSFSDLDSAYLDSENIVFKWDKTQNTTHYNIWIDVKNEQGEWVKYEHIRYVESGVTMKLPVGEYRCELQAYNSEYYWEDGSDWQHSLSDFYYFSVYDLENHTCKGEVMCYVDAHPHYACYKCSICDAVWNNDSETSVVETCLECTLPEKPSFINLKHLYLENENVTFMWDETKNTTHYNIWIDIKNERGEWTRYEHIMYVESGVTMKLPLGEYRCELQAYNSGYYWEDGSDWQHTLSDFCYFSVGCNHIYTGSCDTSCNICGAIRAIVHTWVDATYDAPKTCITCGATEGEALERGNYSPDVTHSVMDTDNGNGLAFRFELTANGVVKDNRNVVDLASATINYLGTDCKLIGMGAIVTNSDAATADLTLDAVNDYNVVDVPTVYLQDADEDSCAFATRITNIPDNQLERTIYARPYYIVEVDGQQIIVYGDVDAACCADSM
ncbi:MAG: CHAP domain-containing protein [Ruminococcaceae bacterium]|nr:CHAP domain-containing protein [Oscillospiraceae bacterium]